MTTYDQFDPTSGRAIRVAVIGAGRIGEVHLSNLIKNVEGAEVTSVHDVDEERARALAARFGVEVTTSLDDLLTVGAPDAVIAGSSSMHHLDHVKRAAKAGIHVFCEKPLALDAAGINDAIQTCADAGALLQIGFNRRFDPNTAEMKQRVESGDIGAVRSIHIISRDPWPPTIEYVRSSGGMIMDMSIHDFDLARFLLGEEVTEVVAFGGCLIDPEIGKAGDVDVATIMLKFESGALGVIENTRATSYGYDQRVEILGSAGALESENMTPFRVIQRGEAGQRSPNPLPFFLERYEKAFSGELQSFCDAIRQRSPVAVSGQDALQAHRIAAAVENSVKEGRPVAVERA